MGGGHWELELAEPAHPVLWPCQSSPKVILGFLTGILQWHCKKLEQSTLQAHGNRMWQSLVPCVGTWVARKSPAVAGVRAGRAWQEVPWDSPEAGGSSLRRFIFLAENGMLKNGTEEVVSLEQCPPTKRLKTYSCNNSKEQRVEEDQTRGNEQRELGSPLAWTVHP